MSRWGLRWILCWLGVLITACTQIVSTPQAEKPQEITPINSYSPPASLTPTMRQPRPTTTATMTRRVTSIPGPDLQIELPICYTSPPDSLICLGRVTNQSNNPLEVIEISVTLYDVSSNQRVALDTRQAAAALDHLLPDDDLPYRVIFTGVTAAEIDVTVQLDREPAVSTADIVPLQISNLDVQWGELTYEINGVLNNDTASSIASIQIVAAISGEDNALTGFRVISLPDQLDAGEKRPIAIQVAPLDRREGSIVEIAAYGAHSSD